MKKLPMLVPVLIAALFLLSSSSSSGFESDELLLLDEEEFEGVSPRSSDPGPTRSTIRKRLSDPESDSKIQFTMEHAFGDSDFAPAGTFSARIKTSTHGGQTLTKLRFSRNSLSEEEKEKFKALLQGDDFYRIRLPSSVLGSSDSGRDYVISSVKARCLPREGIDEHFVIHVEGVNILAVNYGSPGSCPYPRQLKLPTKWSFNSHTILKNSDLAPRAPIFTEEILGGGTGENVEGELVKPPEKTFWAKYWMYLIPLGLIVMNAVTQAMNLPEEQATGTGQPGSQGQAPASAGAIQRGPSSAVRRR